MLYNCKNTFVESEWLCPSSVTALYIWLCEVIQASGTFEICNKLETIDFNDTLKCINHSVLYFDENVFISTGLICQIE